MKILATAARAPNLKGGMWGEDLGDSGACGACGVNLSKPWRMAESRQHNPLSSTSTHTFSGEFASSSSSSSV